MRQDLESTNTPSLSQALFQEALYDTFEKMPDAFLAIDSNWNVIYINQKAAELLACTPTTLLGKNFLQEFPAEATGPLMVACKQALTTSNVVEADVVFGHEKKLYKSRIQPSSSGLLIFFSAVSQQKKALQTLSANQNDLLDFEQAINTTAIVSTTDASGIITWANANYCALSQYTLQELVGKKHSIFENSSPHAEVSQEIWHTFQKGETWRGEVNALVKDGSSIWTHSTVMPILNEQNNPIRSIIVCRNITQQKKAEQELLESEKLYRTLIEEYSDAVLLVDLQGRITKTNKHLQQLISLPEEALLTKNFLDYLPQQTRSQISTALPLLLQGQVLQLKTVITHFEQPFSAEIALVPVQIGGTLRSFFIKLRDISKATDHEKDLSLLNETSLALSTAPNLKDGITEVLRLVSQYADAQYAEFWMPLFGQPFTKLRSSWPTSNEYRLMRAASEHQLYDVRTDKQELFGTSQWHFIKNISENSSVRRGAEAKSCGLNSLLSIPILYRGKILGVVSLFSSAHRAYPHLDADKLQLLVSKLGSELERRQSDEELNKFFAVSPELMGIFTFDGYARKFNPAFEKLLGYTEEEIYVLNFPSLIHPKDHHKLTQARASMHLGHSFKNLELRFLTKDGSYRWVSCTTQSIHEEGLTYLAAHDITEQKLQREEIERIKIAIDNTTDAVGISSSMDRCLYTNQSFERLLGWNVDKMNAVGGPKAIFALPEAPNKIMEHIFEKGHYIGDVELLDSDGNSRTFNLRANTILNTAGKIKYLIGIFTDVSEFKKAQREIVKLSRAVEESANEIYVIDASTFHFTYMNKKSRLNLGYDRKELLTLLPKDVNPAYSKFSYQRIFLPLLRGWVKNILFKAEHIRKDGSRYPVEAHLSWFQNGAENAIMANVIDITERLQAEEALKLSNERYQLVTQATNDAIWDIDAKKDICYYGEGYHSLFGHSFGNSYGKTELWARNIHPEDAERVISNFNQVVIDQVKEWVIEYRFRCADGSYKFVKDRGYAIYDGAGQPTRLAGALADISEHKNSEQLLKEFNESLAKKVEEKTSKLAHALRLMRHEVIARIKTEESLQQSIGEKEVLLKEIHHRVKNNMAIISSLLSLQARNTQQPELKTALKDSQSRIKSMALIHELLYQSRDLSKINFKTYVQELATGIAESFRFLDKEILLEIAAEEAELSIIHAVPCALILNELITNSFKYAFATSKKGCIRIGFSLTENGYALQLSDNGSGLPPDFNPQKTKSLGMQLVCSLVRQIGGIMQVSSEQGSMFSIEWPQNSSSSND